MTGVCDQSTPEAIPPSDRGAAVDPEAWIDRHGDVLYRFALTRLGQVDAAEDVVQEALLGAWQARDRFAGAASERTWLIGILRNKIVDRIRQNVRSETIDGPSTDSVGAFRDGLWIEAQQDWSASPDGALQSREFRSALDGCMQALPSPYRETFCLLEIDHYDSAAVCDILSVTRTNLWTLLHRAKLQLRDCLNHKWFSGRGRP